jgi:hypothetical protein
MERLTSTHPLIEVNLLRMIKVIIYRDCFDMVYYNITTGKSNMKFTENRKSSTPIISWGSCKLTHVAYTLKIIVTGYNFQIKQ